MAGIAERRGKRARPTKFKVKDANALVSLVVFGINHRTAIAHHCLSRFRVAKSSYDRLSLSVDCYMCLISNIEDLEMAYFALREKAAGSKKSFFELFANMVVKEPKPNQAVGQGERSARVMLKQLSTVSLARLRKDLGLPEFDEWKGLGRAPKGLTARELRRTYNAEMLGLRTRLRQAARNRARKRLMKAYIKSKHGFVVLHKEMPPTMLLVERAYGAAKGRHAGCNACHFNRT